MTEKEMIFGIRAIIEAINSDKEIDKIIIKKEMFGELSKELLAAAKAKHIFIQKVPVERLDRYTRKNHQGAIAFLSAVTYQRIEDLVPFIYEQGRDPFILVLDGLTDVRNFGAIARTCEIAGVDAIVIPSRGSVSVNGDAVKTSAGALLKIPVCKSDNLVDSLRFMKNSGLKVFAASEKSNELYTQVDFKGPVCIVMGSEDVGVSDVCLRMADHLVKIPQFGTISSLNVSVAAGILIYEVVRQTK